MSVREHRLPVNPSERAVELVRRSSPSPDTPPLPALPADMVRAISDSERSRAILYAQLDDATDRCYQLAEAIETSGVVIDVIDPDEEDSLVQSLDGVIDAATAYGH